MQIVQRQRLPLTIAAVLLAAAETLLLPALLSAPSPARANPDTLYVATTGDDSGNDCGNSGNPCRTVQHAVDVATPGDEIRVAGGTYAEVNNRGGLAQVVHISKTVAIRGGYTTTNWSTSHPISYPTTLDAQRLGPVGDIPPRKRCRTGQQLYR